MLVEWAPLASFCTSDGALWTLMEAEIEMEIC
jgi:hypothetical protein